MMETKTKSQLKGLTIAFLGVVTLADALHPGMETYQILINGLGMLIFVAAPYWWSKLEPSQR